MLVTNIFSFSHDVFKSFLFIGDKNGNCVVELIVFLVKPLSEYVKKYATEEALREQEHHESSSESSMSDFSDDEVQGMEL